MLPTDPGKIILMPLNMTQNPVQNWHFMNTAWAGLLIQFQHGRIQLQWTDPANQCIDFYGAPGDFLASQPPIIVQQLRQALYPFESHRPPLLARLIIQKSCQQQHAADSGAWTVDNLSQLAWGKPVRSVSMINIHTLRREHNAILNRPLDS